jgi:hypothetical protein
VILTHVVGPAQEGPENIATERDVRSRYRTIVSHVSVRTSEGAADDQGHHGPSRGSAEDEIRLAYAEIIASTWGGHLTAIFTNRLPDLAVATPVDGGAAMMQMPSEWQNQAPQEADAICGRHLRTPSADAICGRHLRTPCRTARQNC